MMNMKKKNISESEKKKIEDEALKKYFGEK